MRLAPVSTAISGLLDFSGSFDTPKLQVGSLIQAAPTDNLDTGTNVPNWGHSELLLVRNVSIAIPVGTVVTLDKDFNAVAAASTANTGKQVYVALTNFSAGSTTPQYGWVMAAGVCPAVFSVAATTGAVFLGTAGAFTPTAAAGKQVLNAVTLIAAASAFTRQITPTNGSKFIKTPRVNGIFIGQTISGTGVSGTVASIDPGGNGFNSSAASTASNTVTGTFTPTGFGVVSINRPFGQGQIT